MGMDFRRGRSPRIARSTGHQRPGILGEKRLSREGQPDFDSAGRIRDLEAIAGPEEAGGLFDALHARPGQEERCMKRPEEEQDREMDAGLADDNTHEIPVSGEDVAKAAER